MRLWPANTQHKKMQWFMYAGKSIPSSLLSSPGAFVSISLFTSIMDPCQSQSTTTSQKCCIVYPRGGKVNTIIGHEWDDLSGLWDFFFFLKRLSPITSCLSLSGPHISVFAKLPFSFVLHRDARLFHPYACHVQSNKVWQCVCPAVICVKIKINENLSWLR